MRKLDLTNQKFGKLTALYPGEPYIKPSGTKISTWVCKCECGNQTTVRTEYLRSGHTISCGCEANKKDLRGQKFGRLTVIDFISNQGWKCQCECGNIAIIKGANLNNGNTKSCGCLQRDRASEATFKDLTGQQFGQLTVLERYPENNRYGHVQYKCQCSCGNITIVDVCNLRNGNSTSCGCSKSRGEDFINKWLQKHNINFRPQYSHDKVILSSGRRPFFDFAILNEQEELLALIEYNGIQHYQPGYGWNDEEHYTETLKRDSEKRQACTTLGIKLYEIPYWDFDNLDEVMTKIITEINS